MGKGDDKKEKTKKHPKKSSVKYMGAAEYLERLMGNGSALEKWKNNNTVLTWDSWFASMFPCIWGCKPVIFEKGGNISTTDIESLGYEFGSPEMKTHLTKLKTIATNLFGKWISFSHKDRSIRSMAFLGDNSLNFLKITAAEFRYCLEHST